VGRCAALAWAAQQGTRRGQVMRDVAVDACASPYPIPHHRAPLVQCAQSSIAPAVKGRPFQLFCITEVVMTCTVCSVSRPCGCIYHLCITSACRCARSRDIQLAAGSVPQKPIKYSWQRGRCPRSREHTVGSGVGAPEAETYSWQRGRCPRSRDIQLAAGSVPQKPRKYSWQRVRCTCFDGD
jgi:hypothetical protein